MYFNIYNITGKKQGVVQDYIKAVEWYQKSAERGNSIAQNNLGYMYENGQGVIQNYTKAIEWYQKAAKQGNTTAKKNLESLRKKLGVCPYCGGTFCQILSRCTLNDRINLHLKSRKIVIIF